MPLEKLNGIRIFIETLNHFIDIDGIAVVSIVDGVTIALLLSNGKVRLGFHNGNHSSQKSKYTLFYKLSDFITYIIIILMWHNFYLWNTYTRQRHAYALAI